MDYGNDVDLSNNNIMPLWKRRTDNSKRPQDLSSPKPRPHSCHINGVMKTNFTEEDNKCSFTLSQPAERLVVTPQYTPNNNYNQPELSSLSSTCSSSPPTHRMLTPSYSSTSSIPSLNSLTSSDPPTPRSPSPEDRGQALLRQSQASSPISPQDTRHTSSSSSMSSTSPSPSLSPPICPSNGIVLSTHSPAALKMGTQQLIPKGSRSLKALSMVETGSYFSTGGHNEGEDGESESPGALRRGLRTTSYRRAVVSGVDSEVSAADPKGHRLSHPVIRGLGMDKSDSLSPDKKKVLTSQLTFDSEELYQNYKENALHNDSDEDPDSREPKPDNNIVVQYRPIRTSWSQLSVVKKSGLCEQISQEERKRQEAIFEVISSEHSYLHSLEILIRMFKDSPELRETMTKTEHHHLFSNITDVCEASKKFFKELEKKHEHNIVIDDITDIVCKHSQSSFDPYITYCSNEVYQQRTLQRLVSKNPTFKEVLTRIEGHPDCRNLPMISFLILPMQRITRLPLLMDTICQKTAKDSPQYEACKKALQAVSKVVRKCNEGARTMERTEMMYTINSQLEFKIKPFPLVSSSRWMVKRGELTAFVDNNIFYKRTSRQQVYFFLFNDVLIVTRKKSEESYTVIDYALRNQISVDFCQPSDFNRSPIRSTTSMLSSRQAGANHLFRLSFRSNCSGDKVTMIVGTELLNERARWISALNNNDNNKKTQDRTNLMQVEVIRTYTARQPDELSLQMADVVLVWQTVEDGWYEGERLRDGERGWFLSECAEPITCQATIERNMQRMDRLQGLETNV
uniref:Rho guanine nucleotide exchange factor 26 n=1 Tax=Oreochromis niloticus TaxID=8128 RepID=A0A669DLW3_ORENI